MTVSLTPLYLRLVPIYACPTYPRAFVYCFKNLSQNEPAPFAPASGSGDNTTVFHLSTPSMKTWYSRLLWSPSMCFSIVMAPNLELPVLMYLIADVSKSSVRAYRRVFSQHTSTQRPPRPSAWATHISRVLPSVTTHTANRIPSEFRRLSTHEGG